MTDTTDIGPLISAAISLTEKVMAARGVAEIDRAAVAASGFVAKGLLTDLVELLEAERQRADDAHKYGSERDSENESLMLTVGRLRVEIAELKGDQKPYGYYSAETETILEQQGHASISAEPLADSRFPLFTAPQKPVVLPSPYYGDRHCLDKREVIAAIEAAGGIVKDGG